MHVSHLDDAEEFATLDGSTIRELAGAVSLPTANQSLAEAAVPVGGATTEHFHRVTEELYLITGGTGRMRLAEEERDVRPGDCIVIPAGARHQIANTGAEPLRLLCCCAPAYSNEDTVLTGGLNAAMISCMARAAALLAMIACFATPSVAPAATLPQIGIADQKPDMFSDSRFAELGIRQARLAVSWDALRHSWQIAEVDAWMQGARAAGIEPLITFGHSRASSFSLPSPKRMRREFRAFRARYPWAKTFASWNEVNHCGEKVCRRPQLVAEYYRALRLECPTCTILAAEVIDLPSMAAWVRGFRRHLGYMPALWGLHNYVEANRFKTVRLREMLRLMGRAGKLWLTETGGVVRRSNNSTTDIPEGARHAGRVTRFIFDDIVKRYPSIQRVYIYHWNAGPPSTTWDSALITYGGNQRAAFGVLRRVLRSALR